MVMIDIKSASITLIALNLAVIVCESSSLIQTRVPNPRSGDFLERLLSSVTQTYPKFDKRSDEVPLEQYNEPTTEEIFCDESTLYAVIVLPKSFVIKPEFNDVDSSNPKISELCKITRVNYRLYPTYRIVARDRRACGIKPHGSPNEQFIGGNDIDPNYRSSHGRNSPTTLQMQIRFPVVESLRTDEDTYATLICSTIEHRSTSVLDDFVDIARCKTIDCNPNSSDPTTPSGDVAFESYKNVEAEPDEPLLEESQLRNITSISRNDTNWLEPKTLLKPTIVITKRISISEGTIDLNFNKTLPGKAIEKIATDSTPIKTTSTTTTTTTTTSTTTTAKPKTQRPTLGAPMSSLSRSFKIGEVLRPTAKQAAKRETNHPQPTIREDSNHSGDDQLSLFAFSCFLSSLMILLVFVILLENVLMACSDKVTV